MGFLHPVGAAIRAIQVGLPGDRSARHGAVRPAVPARRPLHDVREGRVLLSREPRASRGADASAAGTCADHRRRGRRFRRGAAEASVDQVGDARRDRQRGRRHRAQVSGRGPRRRAGRSPAHAQGRGWLCLRPRRDGTVRPHRPRSDRSRRPVGVVVHSGLLSGLRGAAEPGRSDDAAYREPDRASGPDPHDAGRIARGLPAGHALSDVDTRCTAACG